MKAPEAPAPAVLGRIDPRTAWRRHCECRPHGGRNDTRALCERLLGVVYSLSVAHGAAYYAARVDLDEELELAHLLDRLEARGYDRDRLEALAVRLVHQALAGRPKRP